MIDPHGNVPRRREGLHIMPSKNPEVIKKHRDAWYAKNKEKQVERQMIRRREHSLPNITISNAKRWLTVV